MTTSTTQFLRAAALSCLPLLLVLGGTPRPGLAQLPDQNHPCGPIQREAGGYGPYDYRTQRGRLKVVEDFHFTPEVEQLIRGKSASIGGDLSYVMRTSPNHHRALMAIMRYVERTKSPQPPQLQYTIDCYFDRALRFAPNDTVVLVLFARHLNNTGNKPRAEAQLQVAIRHAGNNALSHFNIGLVAMEIGSPELALAQAHRARELGLDRVELENLLRSAGQWREP